MFNTKSEYVLYLLALLEFTPDVDGKQPCLLEATTSDSGEKVRDNKKACKKTTGEACQGSSWVRLMVFFQE
jgi:hypothetical protein